jgi:histidinol-phosphate aminotransferase
MKTPFAHLRLAVALAVAPLFLSLTFAQPTANDGLVRLSSNENAFGFSPRAKARMLAALESGNYYNRDEVTAMVRLAARKEGVPPEWILPTHGSGPVLLLTAAAYSRPGVNVVNVAPGYPQLTTAFAAHGGSIKYVPVGANHGYDFNALRAAIDTDTVIVYICNPNNPTGVLADPVELRRFILEVPPEILVFVDEAYLELSDGGLAANTMAPLVLQRKNLIISRTFSKAYGLAGFRAGYGIAHPEVLARLSKFYQGGPSYLAAIAAQEALQDQEWLAYSVEQYRSVRAYVTAEFDRLGLPYADPQGAFILFRTGMDSAEFQRRMRRENILVTRPFGLGEQTGWEDWARVSIGTKDEMDLFLAALSKILGRT